MVAQELAAVGEIDVLVHGEVGLVESADVVEQAATNQAGRSARAEHFPRLARLRDRTSVRTFEGAPEPGHAVAGAVDDRGVAQIDDARRRQSRARIRVEGGPDRRQPSRLRRGIVVQEREIPAACQAGTSVVAGGEAQVGFEREDTNDGTERRQKFERTVRGSVVDDDQLAIGCRLGDGRWKAPLQPGPAVVVEDDDGNGNRCVVDRRGLADRVDHT